MIGMTVESGQAKEDRPKVEMKTFKRSKGILDASEIKKNWRVSVGKKKEVYSTAFGFAE